MSHTRSSKTRAASGAAELAALIIGAVLLAQCAAPPAAGPAATATASLAATTDPPARPDSYVVDDGDTCNSIAFSFGVTESALISANGLAADCSDLWVGQVLRIPEPARRLSTDEAAILVRKFIFDQDPGMNPAAAFPLEETTPPGAWEQMRAQVFQVREGIQQYQSYAVRDGVVTTVGESFGGVGVNSMLVSDLDSDGSPELLYAYGFGSGMHRSSVGMLRLQGDQMVTTVMDVRYPGDLLLERPLAGSPAVLLIGKPGNGAGTQTLGELHIVEGELGLRPVGETLQSKSSYPESRATASN